MLETVEIDAAEPAGSVIWLHGLGADGHDFEPLVPALRLPMPLRFIFPHAPPRPVTLNGGAVMPAWFDLYPSRAHLDTAGIAAARASVAALVDREIARGTPAARVVVAGFSQGGALALATGLGYPEALAGLVSLSAWLPASESRVAAAQRHTPIFLGHGRDDPVVEVGLGRQTRDVLTELGCAVEWHQYPMAHQVVEREIADVSGFLQRVFG